MKLAHGTNRAALVVAILIVTTLCSLPATAETRIYTLEIPSGRTVRFELDLQIDVPGRLSIAAEWTGVRRLAFRLGAPEGRGTEVHRSGPSPQRLDVDVTESTLGAWRLSIHALPSRSDGQGRVTVAFPEAVAAAAPEAAPAQPRLPEPDPWQRPRPAEAGLSPRAGAVVEATERFRRLVVEDAAAPPDACRWQDGFLRYVAHRRDLLLDQNETATVGTRRLLEHIVHAVDGVDALRTSKDPVLAGPPPGDPTLYEAWRRLRHSRLLPLEDELNQLLRAIRRGAVRDLVDEEWPVRMASCLIACEQYFEARVRLDASRAPHFDLAEAQWSRMLAATEALRALTAAREAGRDVQIPLQ